MEVVVITRRNLTLIIWFMVVWIMLALILPTLRASAAPSGDEPYVVTCLDEPAPGECESGDCSLRKAVIAADIPKLPVIGTIELTRGTFNLHGSTILQGNGADQTSGVIHIFPSQNNPVTSCFPNILDVTITGGIVRKVRDVGCEGLPCGST
jgi:hypothetical protein